MYNNSKNLIFCCTIIFILFFGVNITCAESEYNDSDYENVNKMVLITTDCLELTDFQSCSFIYQLMQNSSIALMNNRQAGKQSTYKSKLNIGTGSRLEINNNMLNATVNNIDDSISYLNINELKKLNSNTDYKSKIGYIGDELNKGNMKTCLIGNSDDISNNQWDRSSALIAMDSSGNIDMGNVDNILTYNNNFHNKKITDFIKLEELYKQFLPACSFMVIDIGDFSRLESNKTIINKEQYLASKSQLLVQIDKFIKNIIEQSKENITFMIVSTYPSKDNIKKGNKLTPIIVYDNNTSGILYSQGGSLYSTSTRRNGIIINTDIADFVLSELGIRSTSNINRVYHKDAYKYLKSNNENIIRVSKLRLPVLTNYAIYEIISAISAFTYLATMKTIKNKSLDYTSRIILLSNMIAPLVLLIMSIVRISEVAFYISIFFITIFTLSLVIKSVMKNKSLAIFAGISFIQVTTTIVDIITGGGLIKHSVLGYDPIIGARFYGIGNEYAGVFIGASILFACSIIELFKEKLGSGTRKISLAAYFAFCTLIIGLPFWGANFGATIAALTGYFFVYVYINKIRINKNSILVFIILVFTLISGIVAIDMISSKQASHIGRFVVDIRKNGVNVLFSTIGRKLAMNMKLIKSTIWTKVLICLLGVILIMFFRPVKIINRIFLKYRNLTGAWIGISSAGVMGLFVNDSGIVMAATAMIFICYPLLMICIDEMNEDIKL